MELVKQHNAEGPAGDRSDQSKATMAYLTCIGSPVPDKRGSTWIGLALGLRFTVASSCIGPSIWMSERALKSTMHR